MKVLLFADMHLDTPFRWAPPEIGRARRQALRDTLSAMVDLAEAEGVDALCSAGDLYEHDMVAPDAAAFLRQSFARLGETPVLMAPGNHDWYGPGSIYASTEWSPNVHVFTGSRPEPFDLGPGATVWGAAHHRPANTPNLLGDFRVDRGGLNVALLHASLLSGLSFQEDGKQPHAPFDEDDITSAGLDHALLGHYHRPRDTPLLTYPGNPEPLVFGETGERAAVILTFEEGRPVQRVRHRVSRTEVVDVQVDVDGAETIDEVRDAVRSALAPISGVARITLTGDVGSGVSVSEADLSDSASHLQAAVFRLDRLGVGFDLDVIADEPTVRGQFVRDVLEADLEPQRQRRILIAGLRALAGRHDLEVSR